MERFKQCETTWRPSKEGGAKIAGAQKKQREELEGKERRPGWVYPVRRRRARTVRAQKSYAPYRAQAEAGAEERGYEDEEARSGQDDHRQHHKTSPLLPTIPGNGDPEGADQHEPRRVRRADRAGKTSKVRYDSKDQDIRAPPNHLQLRASPATEQVFSQPQNTPKTRECCKGLR